MAVIFARLYESNHIRPALWSSMERLGSLSMLHWKLEQIDKACLSHTPRLREKAMEARCCITRAIEQVQTAAILQAFLFAADDVDDN